MYPCTSSVRWFTTLVVGIAVSAVPTAAAETVSLVSSATSSVAVSQTVTVALVLSEGAPFNSFQGYLEWDPALLRLSSVPSTALIDANAELFSAAPGFILTTARAAGAGRRGFFTTAGDEVQPSATLMTWTFTAVATGSAVVRTRQASPTNDYVKLSDQTGTTRYPAVGSDIAFTIGSSATNQAPVVNAGIDQTITLPAMATLSGSATDDGLPTATLTHQWTQVSGPGSTVFSAGTLLNTIATFSVAGTYVLRLTASDGSLSANDTLTVTVNPAPVVNVAPTVNAGADQTITLPAGATLNATVTDDGLPAPSALTYAWTTVSGPGTVTFATATAEDTTASFSAAGTYVLRLTASDGSLSANDTVTVTVNPAPVVNAAPTVNAGVDQTITLPSTAALNATVTDDGLPAPSALTYAWTTVSGPGTVTFATATADDTTASFSAAGTYVLRLTASDGSLSANDTITVTVNTAPVMDGRRILLEPVAGFGWEAGALSQSATTGGRTLVGPYPSASAATLTLIPVGGA